MPDTTRLEVFYEHHRWYAEAFTDRALLLARHPDYRELCLVWDGHMSAFRSLSRELPTNIVQLTHQLDEELRRIIDHRSRDTLERLVTRAAWPRVVRAASELVRALDPGPTG